MKLSYKLFKKNKIKKQSIKLIYSKKKDYNINLMPNLILSELIYLSIFLLHSLSDKNSK